jgi:hypothetical protein
MAAAAVCLSHSVIECMPTARRYCPLEYGGRTIRQVRKPARSSRTGDKQGLCHHCELMAAASGVQGTTCRCEGTDTGLFWQCVSGARRKNTFGTESKDHCSAVCFGLGPSHQKYALNLVLEEIIINGRLKCNWILNILTILLRMLRTKFDSRVTCRWPFSGADWQELSDFSHINVVHIS